MTNDSGPESRSRDAGNSGETSRPSRDREADAARPYLIIAGILVALEGCALFGVAIAELTAAVPGRVGLAVSTSVFFALFGLGLCAAAYGLWRRVSWTRGPVVFAQLIQLGMAWSFRDVSPRAIAIALLLVAVGVLVTVLTPAVTAALTDDPERTSGA